jgi:hypothetical protein
MLRLVRIALLVVIGLLMLSCVVIGLGTENTGAVEKVVLVGFGALLILAAAKVNRIGADQHN